MVDTGYWILDAGHWMLGVRCWMLDYSVGILNILNVRSWFWKPKFVAQFQ